MAKSFFQLSASEIATLNEKARANITSEVCLWGVNEIREALGITVLPEDDTTTPALFTHQKVRYIATRNKTNRPMSLPNMKNLFKLMLERRWAFNGEVFIFDDENNVASAQHRLVAAFLVCLTDPSFLLPCIVIRGVPKEFVDSIDTGKSRDNKDASARHEDIIPLDSLKSLAGFGYGKKAADVRKTLLTELNGVCRLVNLRGQGKDVKASNSGGYKQTEFFAMLERMPLVEKLVERTYAYDTAESGSKGALAKYLGRTYVAAALVLYSNQSNPSQKIVDGKTVSYTLPTSISIDMDFAEKFLHCASQRNGFMSPLYDYIENNSSSKTKIEAPYKMGAVVNAIQWFAQHNATMTIPEATNPETGEIIEPAKEVPTCPKLVKHGIPAAPRTNPETGKPNPFNWPAFGGLDVGYSKETTIDTADLVE